MNPTMEKMILRVVRVVVFLAGLPFCWAQAPKMTLDVYIAESLRESATMYGSTLMEWSTHHAGEVVQAPQDSGVEYLPYNVNELNEREENNRALEGRWCIRATTSTDLAGGIRVRRTALFYQPLVEHTYGKPLPPLPTQSGEALRNRGCKLVEVLHEFDGAPDPHDLLDAIARQLPEQKSTEPGRFLQAVPRAYWKPVYAFAKFGKPSGYHYLFVHDPKDANDGHGDVPAVLLKWQWGNLDYGPPSANRINALAGQPWLELRAAMLAGLPKTETLDMLSFSAPQVGDPSEQPPFFCEKQLIPVLRKWLDQAARSNLQEQAAAILLAHRVLRRLDSCAEFSDSGELFSQQEDLAQNQYAELKKNLQELGVETAIPARIGYEHYTGNMMEKVLRLAPEGPVNKLAHISILSDQPNCTVTSESADCASIIKEGESFLSRFPEDEWTSGVRLMLSEAYAFMATDPDDEVTPLSQPRTGQWEQKAVAQYRAWYAKGTNQRDRALVWQEIWGLEADLGPWLQMPFQRE